MKYLPEIICMLALIAISIAVACMPGCTQKYVQIEITEGCLVVHGNIDPDFLRDGTTESATPTIDLNLMKTP